jgi:hypothetical protein
MKTWLRDQPELEIKAGFRRIQALFLSECSQQNRDWVAGV